MNTYPIAMSSTEFIDSQIAWIRAHPMRFFMFASSFFTMLYFAGIFWGGGLAGVWRWIVAFF